MIYLIHGEEKVELLNTLRSIKRKYSGGFMEFRTDGEFELNDFMAQCTTRPLFPDSKKLIILEVTDSKAIDIPSFYGFLSGGNMESDLVLLFTKSLSPKSKLIKVLRNIKDSSVLQFKERSDKKIFKMLDLFGEKDKKGVLLELRRLLISGHDPLYILSMITYQVRNLLSVKLKAEAAANMHPFVRRKTERFEKHFSEDELVGIMQELLDAEILIKSGRKDAVYVLESLVIFMNGC